MNLGEKIKKYRVEKGLTQQELADIIGVQRAAISKYEKNIVSISINQIEKIASALDITTSQLLYDQEIENTLNQSAEILSNFNPNDPSTFTEVSFEDEVQRQEMYLKELREDTINKYDSLDLFGQKAANKYINFLAKDEE